MTACSFIPNHSTANGTHAAPGMACSATARLPTSSSRMRKRPSNNPPAIPSRTTKAYPMAMRRRLPASAVRKVASCAYAHSRAATADGDGHEGHRLDVHAQSAIRSDHPASLGRDRLQIELMLHHLGDFFGQ